jgi:hypothetical protein
MNQLVVNSVVALNNLDLPDDINDTICGYIYYTLDECKNKVKNKMREVINFYRNNLFMYEGYNTVTTSRTAIAVSDVQFQYEICNICGNYTMTHTGKVHRNVFCTCNPANIIYMELDYNIYDVYYTG